MKIKKENRTLMFRVVRIAMCVAVIGMYFGFTSENSTLANVFDVDDLVLAVGEETNNANVSFSFDGVAPHEIVLSVDYDETQISWQYTLDRGLNWSSGEGLRKKLSTEELAKINTEDGIVVRVTDLINQEEREFVIKIDKAKLPDNLYANDFEDKLYGSVSNLEWSLDGLTWTSFRTSVPNLEGNVTLNVRIPSMGTTLGSEVKTFAFTKSTDSEVRKYVSLSKLTVDSYSSADSSTNAGNVLDGSSLSFWKTLSQDAEKYITLRVASPIYLSGLNILGNVKDAKISVSMDGENWTMVANPVGLSNGENVITLDSSVLTRYIRLEAVSTHDEVGIVSISKIDVFEDNTKRVLPSLKVSYDVVGLTNGNVVAQLVDVGSNITVTSEGGLLHQFTENGSFKFTYQNELGMTGEVVAVVDWIDKVVPTAEVKYVTNSNGSIKASLVNDSEPIEVVNNGGNRSYTFNKNGSFEFVFRDLAGNEGRVTAVANNVVIKRPPVSNNSSANRPSVSKPSTDKKDENNKPSEQEKPAEEKPADKDNDDKKDNVTDVKISNSYSINNISIEVLGDALTTPLALKMDSKEMSKTLKAKVGKASSYFELYFVDADGDRVTINQNYKMILKLDSDKVFKGVFKVEENDKTTKLEYTTRGANEIELNIDSLTNYIISYDEKDENKKGTSAFDYIVALVLAVFLALAAVIVYRRTR